MNGLNDRLRTHGRSISAAEPRRTLAVGFAFPVFLVLYAALAPRLALPAAELLRFATAQTPNVPIDHDTLYYFALVGVSFLASTAIAALTAKLATLIGGTADHHLLFWLCFMGALAVVFLLWRQDGAHTEAAEALFPLALGTLLGIGQGFVRG
jgi:hypothetical protein